MQPCFSFISSVYETKNESSYLQCYFNSTNELFIQKNRASISYVQVFSIQGSFMTKVIAGGNEISINAISWNPGIYLISITLDDGSSISTKIIKLKR